ncbi:unnamed protein product [Rotaria sordida]|uniref:NHL repeat containing protein n=4 Tax=Rotaria sordida TaxID=392033 RepID=A0A815BMT6_9BILA|nr:unnamed protein product [Rotaria sordida]
MSYGLYVDSSGTLYVSDNTYHRVTKWLRNTIIGIVAAGNGIAGSTLEQLDSPQGVWVDGSGNLFVADTLNHRVVKWTNNATSGIVVAGGQDGTLVIPSIDPTSNIGGSSLSQIGQVLALFLDRTTNTIYLSDTGLYCLTNPCSSQSNNYRVLEWPLNGASAGTTVAGSNWVGFTDTQIGISYGLYVDSSGTLFVADSTYHQVTKWLRNTIIGIIAAGNGIAGSTLEQLNSPQGVWVDGSGNLLVADTLNHRVVKWTNNATSGIVIAGGQGQGSYSVQLNAPTGIIIDDYENLFILDAGNQRIMRYSRGSSFGVTIFGGSNDNGFGTVANSMVMDRSGNLYVTDMSRNRVQQIPIITSSVCIGITSTTVPSITSE